MAKTVDMTEGNAVKHILLFSIPLLIGNLFQQVYNLADSVIVGQLVGADALAATGVAGPINFFFFALCNGIAGGGGIITSQSFGAHDDRKVKSCIANTGYIMIAFPLVVGIVSFFLARPLLIALATPEKILDEAVVYTQILCVGLLFVSVYNYVSSMLRALGDSKSPLYFLIFSCFLNIILDIFFVAVLHMGVAGAGIATVIAQFIAGACCLVFAFSKNPYFKFDKESLKIDLPVMWSTVRLGVPLSLQFSLIAISTMALQRVVNGFGEVAVAAFTTSSRIEQLIHQPYQSLSAALSTFVGQNYGARKHRRSIEGYRKSMGIMALFTVVMVIAMQVLGRPITAMFVSDEAVIDMGAKALQITSIFYIFLGVIYTVRGILNGIGDAFFALFNGIVEVIGRFTVPVLLTAFTPLGLWGIWWSVGAVWFLSGATAWMRYLKYWKFVKTES